MTRTLTLTLAGDDPGRIIHTELTAEDEQGLTAGQEDLTERVFAFLDRMQGSTEMKTALYQCVEKGGKPHEILADIHSLRPPKRVEDILIEMLEC